MIFLRNFLKNIEENNNSYNTPLFADKLVSYMIFHGQKKLKLFFFIKKFLLEWEYNVVMSRYIKILCDSNEIHKKINIGYLNYLLVVYLYLMFSPKKSLIMHG